jgi:hypothetical protein
MAQCWQIAGHEVRVVTKLDQVIKADLALIHADLTEVPQSMVDYAYACSDVVINGMASSINKELYSKNIIRKGEGYEGKVIVKTKANYGGMPDCLKNESLSKDEIKQMLAELNAGKQKQRPAADDLWRNTPILDPGNYPVFDAVGDVPEGVWDNANLFVEKYLPEIDRQGNYVLRHWYFFGQYEFSRTLISKSAVPKWASMTKREKRDTDAEWWAIDVHDKSIVPEAVSRIKEDLRLDYGRIDWVYSDGRPVIYDANKTPYIGRRNISGKTGQRMDVIINAFSQGVNNY